MTGPTFFDIDDNFQGGGSGGSGGGGGGDDTPQPTPTPTPTTTPVSTLPGVTPVSTTGGTTSTSAPTSTPTATPVSTFPGATPGQTVTTTAGTTITCPPPGTFLGCESPTSNVGLFSRGIVNGQCGEEGLVTAACPPTPSPTTTATTTTTPTTTTSPICQPGTFQCGETVAISPTETTTLCCISGDICCKNESGQSFCHPGPTCPTTAQCPAAGTLASCLDKNGGASVYTGQKDSNGVCTTQISNNLQCLECPPQGQFLGCLPGGAGNYSGGKIEGLSICATNQINNDPKCQVPPPPQCTPPEGPFEQTVSRQCTAANSTVYSGGTYSVVQSRTFTRTQTTGVCEYTGWRDVSSDFSTCIPRITNPTGCTAPTDGFNQQVSVACTSLGSQYIGGTALQAQTRTYDPSGPTGTVCQYTAWTNSGVPDVSACQLQSTTTTTTTVPNPPAPVACTAPAGPFTEVSSIPCSQIDRKYTSGNATIQRVRRYDSSAQGPGLCPYTEWETTGTPNITLCREPVFWRNCVTGQLVEGNPPTTYIQSNFPQGGTCWEPQTDLGFIPSLSEALRYTYQRGSTKLPEPKSIKITNPSATIAYTVKIATNQNITLSTDKNQSGKGSISFTIEPRSEIRLTMTVTQELLQQLQDGMSTLSVNVEYDRVLQ